MKCPWERNSPHCVNASKEFFFNSSSRRIRWENSSSSSSARQFSYLKEAFIHSNTLDTRSAQQVIPIREVYRAGSFLVSFSPGALYKRAAAGHNTPRHAANMRCTRPLTTPTAGVSFVHSRRSRRSSLGDNLVPAFTGAVRFCEAVHSIAAATYYFMP